MDQRPPETTPREAQLFPVSAESVNKAMEEISRNPQALLVDESLAMEAEDPQLARLIGIFITTPSLSESGATPFMEGALWTRKIIKTHAASVGAVVPPLSHDGGMSLLVSRREKLAAGRLGMGDLVDQDMQALEQTDPELGKGLREMSKYRGERYTFLEGATTAYFATKRMDDSNRLTRDLKL